jgi:hypothetical protein
MRSRLPAANAIFPEMRDVPPAAAANPSSLLKSRLFMKFPFIMKRSVFARSRGFIRASQVFRWLAPTGILRLHEVGFWRLPDRQLFNDSAPKQKR